LYTLATPPSALLAPLAALFALLILLAREKRLFAAGAHAPWRLRRGDAGDAPRPVGCFRGCRDAVSFGQATRGALGAAALRRGLRLAAPEAIGTALAGAYMAYQVWLFLFRVM